MNLLNKLFSTKYLDICEEMHYAINKNNTTLINDILNNNYEYVTKFSTFYHVSLFEYFITRKYEDQAIMLLSKDDVNNDIRKSKNKNFNQDAECCIYLMMAIKSNLCRLIDAIIKSYIKNEYPDNVLLEIFTITITKKSNNIAIIVFDNINATFKKTRNIGINVEQKHTERTSGHIRNIYKLANYFNVACLLRSVEVVNYILDNTIEAKYLPNVTLEIDDHKDQTRIINFIINNQEIFRKYLNMKYTTLGSTDAKYLLWNLLITISKIHQNGTTQNNTTQNGATQNINSHTDTIRIRNILEILRYPLYRCKNGDNRVFKCINSDIKLFNKYINNTEIFMGIDETYFEESYLAKLLMSACELNNKYKIQILIDRFIFKPSTICEAYKLLNTDNKPIFYKKELYNIDLLIMEIMNGDKSTVRIILDYPLGYRTVYKPEITTDEIDTIVNYLAPTDLPPDNYSKTESSVTYSSRHNDDIYADDPSDGASGGKSSGTSNSVNNGANDGVKNGKISVVGNRVLYNKYISRTRKMIKSDVKYGEISYGILLKLLENACVLGNKIDIKSLLTKFTFDREDLRDIYNDYCDDSCRELFSSSIIDQNEI